MGEWIKCPRCDLNYMKRGEEYCDVYKAELKKAPPLVFAVDDDDENEGLELCPICHQNYIGLGEKMCAKCMEERDYKESREDLDDDETWKEFLDDEEDDEEDEEMLSLNKLAEEEGDFEEEEEEESYMNDEPDDFDMPDIDEEEFNKMFSEDDEDEDIDEDDEEDEDYDGKE